MSTDAALLAVFAHPDDEAYRCGGTLALLSRHGVRVQVLTASRGQAGSWGDPPLCAARELGLVRERELRCSCEALGVLPPRLLDYDDGRLAEVDEDQAVAHILAMVRELRPQVILTWPSHGLSGHPDHIAVSRWATAACNRAATEGMSEALALYYVAVPESVAGRLGLHQLRTTPDEMIAVTVDVRAVWAKKMAAIECHRTQLGESPILRAPLAQTKLFLGEEHFVHAAATPTRGLLPTLLGQNT